MDGWLSTTTTIVHNKYRLLQIDNDSDDDSDDDSIETMQKDGTIIYNGNWRAQGNVKRPNLNRRQRRQRQLRAQQPCECDDHEHDKDAHEATMHHGTLECNNNIIGQPHITIDVDAAPHDDSVVKHITTNIQRGSSHPHWMQLRSTRHNSSKCPCIAQL